VSRHTITTECADLQAVEDPVRGWFLIVLRVFGRSETTTGRDEAGGVGGRARSAAGG
jgi:hypothetical protein